MLQNQKRLCFKVFDTDNDKQLSLIDVFQIMKFTSQTPILNFKYLDETSTINNNNNNSNNNNNLQG